MQVNFKKNIHSLAKTKIQNPAVYMDYKEEFEDWFFFLLDFMFGLLFSFDISSLLI